MSSTNESNKLKIADTEYPVHNLIRDRWSPYSFSDKMVENEDLQAIFEAARWAPSCFNEQPWRYIVATRDQVVQFEKILSCLNDANRVWAKYASTLVLAVASNTFLRNGKPNRHAHYDLGQASANMSIEATSRNIHLHQMAGFRRDKARELYNIPDGYEAVTAIAIGYTGKSLTLPDEIANRDIKPRKRRPLKETVFGDEWGFTNHAIVPED